MSLPVSLPSPAVEAVTPPVRETPPAISEAGSYSDTPTFAKTLAKQQETGDPNQLDQANPLNAGKKLPPPTKDATPSETLTENADASTTEKPKTEAEHPKHEPKKDEAATANNPTTAAPSVGIDAPAQLSRPELLLAQLLQPNSVNGAVAVVTKAQDSKSRANSATGKTVTVDSKTTTPNAQRLTPDLNQIAEKTGGKTENSMDSHTAKAATPSVSGVDFPTKTPIKPNTSSAFTLPDPLKPGGDAKTSLTIAPILVPDTGRKQSAAQAVPTPQLVAESVLRSAVRGNSKGITVANGAATPQTDPTATLSGVTATNPLATLDALKNPLNPAANALRATPELAVLLGQTGLTDKIQAITGRETARTATTEKSDTEDTTTLSPTEGKAGGNPLVPLLSTEGVRPQSEVTAVASVSHRLAQTANAENAENAQKLETRTQIIAQVEKHTERMAAIRGTGEIDIRLEPEHLGALHIRIVKDGETVTARISAENQQVRQLLESGQQDLKDALKERGFQMQNLEFTNSTAGNTGSGGQFSNAFAQADPNAQRSFGSQNPNRQNNRGYREDNLEAGLAPLSAPKSTANGRLDYRA